VANNPWWLIGFKPIGDSSRWTFEVFQGTKAQAEAKQHLAVNGTLDGPFATRAQAVAAETKERKKPIPPSGLPPGIPNPLHALGSVEQFLTLLANRNLWFRVAEVTIGGVLIAAGVSAIVKDVSPVGQLLKPLKGIR